MSDLISRQAAIDTLKNRWKKTRHYEGIGDDIAEECELYLKQVPSAQPSVSKEEMVGDTISRQAAIKAICEDGTMLERQGKYTMTMAERKQKDADILDTLPSAQPDVPDINVGDMISRQAAISEIMEDIKDRSLHDDPATPEDYAEGYDEGIRNAAAIVLQMPSAQPGWTTDVNNILAYLDGTVHPLVSPENWNVYSELYDMVSGLLKPWEGKQDGEG